MTDFDTKVKNAIGRISRGLENKEIGSFFDGYKNSKREDFLSRLSIDLLAGALVYVSNYQGDLSQKIPFYESDVFLFSVSTEAEELTAAQEEIRDANVQLFENVVDAIIVSGDNAKRYRELGKTLSKSVIEQQYSPRLKINLSLVRYIRSIVYS